MKVDSYNIEFGYELLSALPYAYGLHLEGKLTETNSGYDTKPLYYFSPKHTERNQPRERSWFNTDNARKQGLPYTTIHRPERPKLNFPNYKEVYKNDIYKWDKPTLVIANRYNREWGCDPINFFDENILDWLFGSLKAKYEIVYFAVDLPEHYQDDAKPRALNDREVADRHGVKVFQDIRGESWNTSLLQIFANCEHYITMNGGYSIMASLFTGTNIIYSRRDGGAHSFELHDHINSFFRWYPNHNNQRTLLVENHKTLKEKIQAIYIDELPTVNIITRTSNRPNAFAHCYKSIEGQDYPNINMVVTTDEQWGVAYTRPANARHLAMPKIEPKEKPKGENYGVYFPQNEYIDIAQKLVNGYIIAIDDDDVFTCSNAVSEIMKVAQKDALTIWRVDFNNNIIHPNGSFGKEIKLFDITGIGICYHSDHIDATDWSQWKRADYRTAKGLEKKLGKIVWLDAILTKLQLNSGYGNRIDIITKKDGYMKTVRILKECAGQVGTIKRIPKPIADEQVLLGNVEYFSDVVNGLNKVVPVGKPIVVENKAINLVKENKDGDNKPVRGATSRTRKGKATLKGNK
jgi:hypothetical protein